MIRGLSLLLPVMLAQRLPAQTTAPAPLLTHIPGSTVKMEQVIGDCDYQAQAKQIVAGQTVTCVPTTSQTVTRFDVAGNGQGSSFEDNNGRLIFFFGDTISSDPSVKNYGGADPIAWSTSTDPEQGLLLNFYTDAKGGPLFVKPPGIEMGPDDIPNAGINVNGQTYFICSTGSQTSAGLDQSQDYSVLVQFDETAQTFTAGRTISPTGGHFLFDSLYASGRDVFIFGAGPYRQSDIYLQMVPSASFASGGGTQYFTGLVNGKPTWGNSEAGVVPVAQDNPLNGPPWPNDTPTVGYLSVVYSSALNLWLMTYGASDQSPGDGTRGTYFTYAQQPWGPWATPQHILNDNRDNFYGLDGFVHNPLVIPDPPGDGLNGPTIGNNDIYATAGGIFAPQLIGRFVTVTGNTLKIYYNVSTWNPYVVVRIRSEFAIANAPAISLVANAEGEGPTIAPNTWVEIQGVNLAPANDSRTWQGSDFVNNQMPTQLDGVSVLVNGKSAYVYYISPTQINVLTPPNALSGPVQVTVSSNGITSTAFTAQAQTASPSFFVFNGGPYVAAEHLNGNLIGPPSLYPGSTTQAQPGETVVLYANGFGTTSVPVVAGSVSQSGTLSPLPVIQIGGINATVQFAGLVGPGEFQFNVVVPTSLTNGDQTIAATYTGSTTQAGTMITVHK
jgi:uncharacterized protein (TIGR03437 family)